VPPKPDNVPLMPVPASLVFAFAADHLARRIAYKMRQVHVHVPSQAEYRSCGEELTHQLLICEEGVDDAEQEEKGQE
jgi:hypothetical protein